VTWNALTPTQKLQALAHKHYQNVLWKPKSGDYYTSSRADLELYRVVSVGDGLVRTTYLPEGGTISEWPADQFLSDDTFGRHRVWVPNFILNPTS
jgi:hypothetical protein